MTHESADRIAYADRPAVVAEWCTCPRDGDGRARWFRVDADGDLVETSIWVVDPNCPLHGPNAQPAPF